MIFRLSLSAETAFRKVAKVNFVKLRRKAWLLIKHAVNFYTWFPQRKTGV
jgi:hypothetical protein